MSSKRPISLKRYHDWLGRAENRVEAWFKGTEGNAEETPDVRALTSTVALIRKMMEVRQALSELDEHEKENKSQGLGAPAETSLSERIRRIKESKCDSDDEGAVSA